MKAVSLSVDLVVHFRLSTRKVDVGPFSGSFFALILGGLLDTKWVQKCAPLLSTVIMEDYIIWQ